jgi:hypothetical protein
MSSTAPRFIWARFPPSLCAKPQETGSSVSEVAAFAQVLTYIETGMARQLTSRGLSLDLVTSAKKHNGHRSVAAWKVGGGKMSEHRPGMFTERVDRPNELAEFAARIARLELFVDRLQRPQDQIVVPRRLSPEGSATVIAAKPQLRQETPLSDCAANAVVRPRVGINMAKRWLAIGALALALALPISLSAVNTKPNAGVSAAMGYGEGLAKAIKRRTDEFVEQVLKRPAPATRATQTDPKGENDS